LIDWTVVEPHLRDGAVLYGEHVVLCAVLVVAILGALRRRVRRVFGHKHLKVARGEKSMTILYVAYALMTVALTATVQVADEAQGYKVALIVFDYLALCYLFFFNSWFRNRLLRLLGRVYED
jgi:cytochrome c biogenesis factor